MNYSNSLDLTTVEIAAGMLCVSASVANSFSVSVFAGRNNTVKGKYPHVICIAESAEQFIPDTNIFRVNLVVQVEEKAVDTNISSSLGKTMHSAFSPGNDVCSKMITLSSGSLFVYKADQSNFTQPISTDDKTWIKEMSVSLICASTV